MNKYYSLFNKAFITKMPNNKLYVIVHLKCYNIHYQYNKHNVNIIYMIKIQVLGVPCIRSTMSFICRRSCCYTAHPKELEWDPSYS